jgi:hypothetical protein
MARTQPRQAGFAQILEIADLPKGAASTGRVTFPAGE